LHITQAFGQIHLDWSVAGPLVPPATHYHIYRATSPEATFPSAWTLLAGDSPKWTTQVYDDPSLNDGSTYYYQVRAVDDCEDLSP
jgi:hypothetical protein